MFFGIEVGVEVYSIGEKCIFCEFKNYMVYSKIGIGLDSVSVIGDDILNGIYDIDVWIKVLVIICEFKKGLEIYKCLGSWFLKWRCY